VSGIRRFICLGSGFVAKLYKSFPELSGNREPDGTGIFEKGKAFIRNVEKEDDGTQSRDTTYG